MLDYKYIINFKLFEANKIFLHRNSLRAAVWIHKKYPYPAPVLHLIILYPVDKEFWLLPAIHHA